MNILRLTAISWSTALKASTTQSHDTAGACTHWGG